ncbi:TapB family protein [Dyadobacter sediminis]|uniref:DUF3108 domain-containing protein n=1 Tax=Dyadobacter sediminis TaxID=1493691 RepID=A0A5R9KIB0_9BACT|nr:hypothetical protein [Dyadobacter sediminis]TLU95948.1 hypothetical protein FEM55_02010 [Dyadobacter sediminis]GGB77982.1 hypothetical protein GCM10011325_01840 [Dyadobacter sediminis]
MKKNLIWCILFICISALYARAQECAGVILKEGSGFEASNFDSKGKPAGKFIYKLAKIMKEGSSTVFTVDMEFFNTKGKSELKNSYKMKCDGNVLQMDVRSLINHEQLKTFQSMEMEFTYDNIEFPGELSVGEKLKDASVEGTGKSGPVPVTFNLMINNRNVTAQEKLNVPAGTFNAYKITSDMNMEMAMGIPVKIAMQSISYRAPGVIWDIKTENYRKGKLISYSELSRIY